MKIQFLEKLNCKNVHENHIGCIMSREKSREKKENLLKYKWNKLKQKKKEKKKSNFNLFIYYKSL